MQTPSTTPGLSSGVPVRDAEGVAGGAGRGPGPAPSAPVFVDSSGRRRKTWRRLTIAVVAVLCGYACMLGIGFAGGPIPPAALLPIPGIPGNGPAPSDPGHSSVGADTSRATPGAKDTGRLAGPAAPSHSGGPTSDAAKPTRTTAAEPTPPQPSGLPSASGAPVPTPTGTTVVSPAGSTSKTHGPPATPPGQSRSKTR